MMNYEYNRILHFSTQTDPSDDQSLSNTWFRLYLFRLGQ